MSTTLGDELKGIYVFGSLVIGDFDPQRSDVDMLAMVEHDITEQQLDSLESMHDQFVERHPSWRGRIEVGYVSVGGMRDFKTRTCRVARIAPGDPLGFQDMDIDWLMDWYMVLCCGQTVQGPPPRELIPEITQQEFVASLRRRLPNWLNEAREAHHAGYQSYIILSLCRSIYVFAHGGQVSKIQAAKWAVEQFPDWAELILDALSWKGSPDKSDSPETRARTEEFVRFVLAEADKKF